MLRREQQEIAGTKFHASLQQSILHSGDAGGAAEQNVECGNLAELFVAQESEFFFGIALGSFLNGGQALADEACAGTALIDERANGEGGKGDDEEDEKCDQR